MSIRSTDIGTSLAAAEAYLFDLDGVITPTAMVHRRAWSRLFNDYFDSRGIRPAYTEDDYFAHVDGRPRYDGVRDVLATRGVVLPEGSIDDLSDAETVAGLGNRKNELFTAELTENGIEAYPGSLQFLDIATGHRIALVSSSRNAVPVLESAGILERFEVIVDGTAVTEHALTGKPAPDTFLFAAHQLGVPPERCVVFEDAPSGVEAGHAGAFGLVIGVDRGAGVDTLTAAGADHVVADLADLVPLLSESRA